MSSLRTLSILAIFLAIGLPSVASAQSGLDSCRPKLVAPKNNSVIGAESGGTYVVPTTFQWNEPTDCPLGKPEYYELCFNYRPSTPGFQYCLPSHGASQIYGVYRWTRHEEANAQGCDWASLTCRISFCAGFNKARQPSESDRNYLNSRYPYWTVTAYYYGVNGSFEATPRHLTWTCLGNPRSPDAPAFPRPK